jgi:NADPH-dependent curcumin reductase
LINLDNSWSPTTQTVRFDPVGPEGYGKVAVLVKRPDPLLDDSCIKIENRDVPDTVDAGTVMVKNTHYSMDPTHMIWAQDIPQYMPAVGLDTIMRCLTLGEVVKSSDEKKFPLGTIVSVFGGLAEYSVIPFAGVNATVPGVPVEMNLGPFSLIQGHTAWVGHKICQIKAGDTFVVSCAAGAVGSMAGQLGKIAGARVIGIAGGPEKCKMLTDEFGFDGAIDYKNESLDSALTRLCPKGIDCFFDNVGGNTLDTVIAQMNCFGRIAICGSISQYDGKMGTKAVGFKNVEMMLMRRLTMQGYVVVDHMASVNEAMGEIGAGIQSGTIKWKGDVRTGTLDDYVKTINLLLSGGNNGKLILKV